jgi:hypothetical protein
MGFWSSLTGDDAAGASRAAAQDTYQKQQAAIAKLLGYGDEYKARVDEIGNAFDPFTQMGMNIAQPANDALSHLISNPESVRSLPGYQFDMDQGVQALDRSANARHMSASGRASKDLLRFGTGLADNTYGSQIARLMALNNQGYTQAYTPTAAKAGYQAQGLQGQLGARTTAYGGDMNSAGTIGQGDIAAANAQAAGSQNLLNAGLKLGGMALGGFSGGARRAEWPLRWWRIELRQYSAHGRGCGDELVDVPRLRDRTLKWQTLST